MWDCKAGRHKRSSSKATAATRENTFQELITRKVEEYLVIIAAKYFEEEGDHADEMETSIMMHLQPDLVLPLSVAGSGNEKKNTIEGFREKWAWTERRWSEVTEDTGIGNPKKSTKEKGERFFNDLTDKISDLILDLCDADSTNLYQ